MPTVLPAGFTESLLIAGLDGPTAMEFAPDGRLFMLEQEGDVELIRPDGTTWTALELNVAFDGERGLLGIAFDPQFAKNHYVYLYYTNSKPGAAPWATGVHNQISRFTVDDTNPREPVFRSETPILDLNTLTTSIHNAGAIHFGIDGKLYAATGDNAQVFTQNGNSYRASQSLSSLLGKVLRIDVSAFNDERAKRDDIGIGKLIPTDNPFIGKTTGINQLIYSLGLRNPFTFAVQPKTGKVFVNDVGETTWEEINQATAGANYGWSGGNTDGFGQKPVGPGTYRDPVLAYSHAGGPAGHGSSIVGGAFYNPATPQFPTSYQGKYFYGDFGASWIRLFDPAQPGTAAKPDTSISFATEVIGDLRDLKVDSMGNLYFLTGDVYTLSDGATAYLGAIYVISYQTPKITQHPADRTIDLGKSVSFTVAAGEPSPSYQWQHLVGGTWKNVGTNASTYTISQASTDDAGDYRVIVSNQFASTISLVGVLTVNIPNAAPKIHTQPEGRLVNAGQPAVLTVTASGSIPLSYKWQRQVGSVWKDVGTNASTFTINAATPADAGSYRVTISNTLGSVTSQTVPLKVDRLPTATISMPATGTTFTWGQTIHFVGKGTDPEDGLLGNPRFSWTVDFYHDDSANGSGLHHHPFQTFPGVPHGSFVANFAETSPHIWYRITLTVTDRRGNSSSSFVDIRPLTAKFTVTSDPAGFGLLLDGGPIASGTTITGTVGQPRTLGVVTPKTVAGVSYLFQAWSDGGAPSHTITTPSKTTTYTARFVPQFSPGLKAEYFDFTLPMRALPNLTGRTPVATGFEATINHPRTLAPWSGLDRRFADTFATRQTGSLKVDTAGRYTFALSSDEGSKLWIDGTLVVNNDGLHAARTKTGAITLSAGLHAIRVEAFENTGWASLSLAWTGPGFRRQIIPAANLLHSNTVSLSAITARAAQGVPIQNVRGPRPDRRSWPWIIHHG